MRKFLSLFAIIAFLSSGAAVLADATATNEAENSLEDSLTIEINIPNAKPETVNFIISLLETWKSLFTLCGVNIFNLEIEKNEKSGDVDLP
ncbi:hypothetical protein [Bartonella sp. F02]|uniref:hypothetical protein n=1 Tax=Bartonella sp. F02 TaxID=2967262 RepID=UPI0022A93FE9|nr:hypothetical protein [Bartonella sp. F02]MCZ2328251.1 hypothetical protein [Bartonella sp. F02]